MKITKPDKIKCQNKIIKVIDSCESQDHMQITFRMIEQYIRVFDAGSSGHSLTIRALERLQSIS